MTTEQTKELGARLKALRIKKGLHPSQIAEEMGVGYKAPVVHNIEAGLKPVGLVMLSNYVAACGCVLRLEFQEV